MWESEYLVGWCWSPEEAAPKEVIGWILPITMLSHTSFVPSANVWLLLLYRFLLHPFVSLVTLTACLLLLAITHLSEVWQIVLYPQIHPHLSDLWVCVHVTIIGWGAQLAGGFHWHLSFPLTKWPHRLKVALKGWKLLLLTDWIKCTPPSLFLTLKLWICVCCEQSSQEYSPQKSQF